MSVHDFFRELTRERFGSINCRDISSCDFTNPKEAKAFIGSGAQDICAELLADTMRFVLPLLDNLK